MQQQRDSRKKHICPQCPALYSMRCLIYIWEIAQYKLPYGEEVPADLPVGEVEVLG